MTIDQKIISISKGTQLLTPAEDLKKKLEKNTPLIIKLGADPTSPNLHLGHAVVLLKMKQLQEMGHKIIFLIGDFTARIGDPSGKSKTRPVLSEEEIKKNTETYVVQISKILDISKTTIRYNSEWLENLSMKEWIMLCGKTTLARIIEREDFKERIEKNISVGMHELMYPLMQGYDSIALKADIEIGGTDQTFNLLMGRFLQEQYQIEPQIIITMPILEGLDGEKKMSKSLHNDIGLIEEPSSAFGKIMSINDIVMINYYRLLLEKNESELEEIKKIHPKIAKKSLAFEVIKKFWSEKDAFFAKNYFENKFEKKKYQEIAKELVISTEKPFQILLLLNLLNLSLSKSEIKRLILQNAVSLNEIKINNFSEIIIIKENDILKIGKHNIFIIKNASS